MNNSKRKNNLGLLESLRVDQKYIGKNLFGFPDVRKAEFKIKGDLHPIAFGEKPSRFNSILHFFVDDFKFNSVYDNLANGLRSINREMIKYVCAPDFSLYQDWPHAINIFNIYKNRLVTRYWQEKSNKNIIPIVNWSNVESWEYCFLGLPSGGIFCLNRFIKDGGSWERGFLKFYEICEPNIILLFGEIPETEFLNRFQCEWVNISFH